MLELTPKVSFLCRELNDPVLATGSTPPRRPIWTSISFSNNGEFILIGTSGDVHYIVDAFSLYLHARLEGHKGLEHDQSGQKQIKPRRGASGHEVCWTSDSNWVLSGSHDGRVHAWNVSMHPRDPESDNKPKPEPQTLQPVVNLLSSETTSAPTTAVKMSSRYGVMAVGSDSMVCFQAGWMLIDWDKSSYGRVSGYLARMTPSTNNACIHDDPPVTLSHDLGLVQTHAPKLALQSHTFVPDLGQPRQSLWTRRVLRHALL